MDNLGLKLYIAAMIVVPLLVVVVVVWEFIQASIRQRRLRKMRQEVIALARAKGII